MTNWSYDTPSGSDRDAVRLLIGDTIAEDPILADDEIDWFLSEKGDPYRAAAAAARAIAAKFARLMSRSIGGMQADFGQKYRQYIELAKELESRQDEVVVTPFRSGWRKAARTTVESDTDREELNVVKGFMDNVGTSEDVNPADGYLLR